MINFKSCISQIILISFILLISCEICKSSVDEEYTNAAQYRLYPVIVWGNEVLKFIPFIGEKASLKIALHHLVGNAIYIMEMQNPGERYHQRMIAAEKALPRYGVTSTASTGSEDGAKPVNVHFTRFQL